MNSYPILTTSELSILINKLALIFDVVRIVDASLQRVITYDPEGNRSYSHCHCYDPSLPLANKKWSLFGSIFFNKYAVFPVDMWLLDF